MKIPLFDVTVYNPTNKTLEAMRETIEKGQFILGPAVENFEQEVARYLEGTKGPSQPFCTGVASGTDALVLALRATIAPGQEVITTALSFVATASAIVRAGGVPVFVDIGEDFNIDPYKVGDAITAKTGAILPVNLYGRVADLETLSKYKIPIIVDAAQSFGAIYNKERCGSYVNQYVVATCFSFFPTKPFACIGDGGMVVSYTEDFDKQIKLLRNQGSRVKCDADIVGYNSRLDAIQAAVLSRKLKYVDQDRKEREAIAKYYIRKLEFPFFSIFLSISNFPSGSAWAVFPLLVGNDKRESLKGYLTNHKIGTAVHYPKSLGQMRAFMEYSRSRTPLADEIASKVLSIPCYAGMTVEQQEYVVKIIKKWWNK